MIAWLPSIVFVIQKRLSYCVIVGLFLLVSMLICEIVMNALKHEVRARILFLLKNLRRQDVYEMSGQSKGQQIAACLELCDVQIENKEGLGNLFAAVDDILEMFAKDQYV